MKPEHSQLGNNLVEQGLLTSDQLQKAIQDERNHGTSLTQVLLREGWLDKKKIYENLANVYGVVYMDVASFQVQEDVIKLISGTTAHQYHVIPLFKIDDTLTVAMEDPANTQAIDKLKRQSRCEIDACLGASDDIANGLTQYYGARNRVSTLIDKLSGQESVAATSTPTPATTAAEEDDYAVVELVDLILQQAVEEGVSDIHLEPGEDTFRIRYRVDGVLQSGTAPPKDLQPKMISRVKIMAGMDIAENRVPQDGRIKQVIGGDEIDMRVSTMPTVFGEKVVIRILKDSASILDMDALGMDKETQEKFNAVIQNPYGMILETGPTGCGKTTSLYVALKSINTLERNIVTVEDPVEYKLPGISQINVNEKAGLTFFNVLRSILRQDPDVIMVGEIRDTDTAQLAMQAAMTGHLVFSTLHTNDAASAVTRLADMKIERFLISAAVICVISQRLVRKICPKCKVETKISDFSRDAMGLDKDTKVYAGKGCRHCNNTGFKGRVGIFEILRITPAIQKLIMAKSDAASIVEAAKEEGFKTIREDAIEKIKQGVTTFDEVVMVIGA